tara:strand:+ start:118 stop:384 length:267 start_codon:yes stop_codon:yes gene_type:complete
MKVKGKKIINSEEALEFANSIRGQYIISQALTIANSVLETYEVNEDMIRAEPSNRADMQFLLKAFPLYGIHEQSNWEEDYDGWKEAEN